MSFWNEKRLNRLPKNWNFALKFTATVLRKSLKTNVEPEARNIECIIRANGKEFTIKSVTSEHDSFTGFTYPIINAEEI